MTTTAPNRRGEVRAPAKIKRAITPYRPRAVVLTLPCTATFAFRSAVEEAAHALGQFVSFLARKRARFITIPLALEWSQQPKDVQRATWARKLSNVRQFASWMSVIEPRHQVPPRRLLDVRHRRGKPHIYSDEEIGRLMIEAAKLKSPTGMKPLNLQAVIGLLAATGLRPGEAAALERSDVNLEVGVLSVRESKFGKSREVPIHTSTVAALKRYARQRDQIIRNPGGPFFFLSDRGAGLNLHTIQKWFREISPACGLRKEPNGHQYGRGPRLQDLRHTFATKRLVEWYRAGCDVAVQMPKLATYLGHSSVVCTYWYIEAIPELLELATEFQRTSIQGGRQ